MFQWFPAFLIWWYKLNSYLKKPLLESITLKPPTIASSVYCSDRTTLHPLTIQVFWFVYYHRWQERSIATSTEHHTKILIVREHSKSAIPMQLALMKSTWINSNLQGVSKYFGPSLHFEKTDFYISKNIWQFCLLLINTKDYIECIK